MTGAAASSALLAALTPVVEATLAHHAERGDAQTCTVLARTLSPLLPEIAPKSRVQLWTLGYVSQLHKLGLFAPANDVIKSSDDERVYSLNQRSTTIAVGGGGASSSAGRAARARCAVCTLPVRGLIVWCQGCGHGGHERCLREWFATNLECPTGCGHICLLRHPAPVARPAAAAEPPVCSPLVYSRAG